MNLEGDNRNYLESLVSLYQLLINLDGHVDEKEKKIGETMRKQEGIEEWKFNYYLKRVEKLDRAQLLQLIITSLSKCDYESQVRCIAWVSNIANSDGFMSPEEWKLIFYIYDTRLKLDIKDILEVQKKLLHP